MATGVGFLSVNLVLGYIDCGCKVPACVWGWMPAPQPILKPHPSHGEMSRAPSVVRVPVPDQQSVDLAGGQVIERLCVDDIGRLDGWDGVVCHD